eukprot:UN01201
MTLIYLFKKFDFCKGIPLGKSKLFKVVGTCRFFFQNFISK